MELHHFFNYNILESPNISHGPYQWNTTIVNGSNTSHFPLEKNGAMGYVGRYPGFGKPWAFFTIGIPWVPLKSEPMSWRWVSGSILVRTVRSSKWRWSEKLKIKKCFVVYRVEIYIYNHIHWMYLYHEIVVATIYPYSGDDNCDGGNDDESWWHWQ